MDMNKQKIITGILAFITAVVLFIMGVMQSGCMSAPDKKNYGTDLEFTLADCLYRAQKNPIVCDKLAERYRDWHKEKSYKDRLEYCKVLDNLPKNWDLEKCLYYVNQK